MTRNTVSARSTWRSLLPLLLSAAALTACKPSSTRPSTEPTPPPVVTCDRTPPPKILPKVPWLHSAADLADGDAWMAMAAGLYQAEVTLRQQEHACWAQLRKQGVIR